MSVHLLLGAVLVAAALATSAWAWQHRFDDSAHARVAVRWLTLGLLAIVVAFAFTSCGGNASESARPLEPSDVARAYVTAAYQCGEAGAGRAYDLSTSTARTMSRAQFIAEEWRRGCFTQPVPTLNVVRPAPPRGDLVTIYVEVIPDPNTTEGRGVLTLLLRRTEGSAWKVDTQGSTDPEWLTRS